jgi:hypothetical protein
MLDSLLRDGQSGTARAGSSAGVSQVQVSKAQVLMFFRNMALNSSVVPSIHEDGSRTYKVCVRARVCLWTWPIVCHCCCCLLTRAAAHVLLLVLIGVFA